LRAREGQQGEQHRRGVSLQHPGESRSGFFACGFAAMCAACAPIMRYLITALVAFHAIASFAQAKQPRRDAAVEAIMVPSDDPRYASQNPAVQEPRFVLRNKGRDPLHGISVRYGTDGFKQRMFAWTGMLASGASVEVQLPHLIDMNAGSNRFTVALGDPNGKRDKNPADNTLSTTFTAAPTLSSPITVRWRVSAGAGGSMRIENTRGPVPFARAWSAGADSVFSESVELPVGSYVLHLLDSSRTAHASVRVFDERGELMAAMRGKDRTASRYQFRVEVNTPVVAGRASDAVLMMLPGRGQALVDAYSQERSMLVVANAKGETVMEWQQPEGRSTVRRIDLAEHPAGSYAIKLIIKGEAIPVGNMELIEPEPR